MKNCVLKITALSSLLLSIANLAAAAPSAEIKVLGELIAPTCQVTLPYNGVFDYGSISHTLVDTSKPVSLGTKGGSDLHVSCSAPTPLTFKVIDNRSGTASVADNQHFGLGNVNNTGKLGYYQITAKLGRVDGALSPLFATSDGTIPNKKGDVIFDQNKRIGWSSASNGQELAIGKDFTFMMFVEAFLAKRGDMNGGLGEGVNLDGSATLEFGFGL